MRANFIKLNKLLAITVLMIITIFLSGCNAGKSSSNKEITSYSLNGISGIITGQNIAVILPYGTNTNSLIATFTTTGINITVNNIPQVSEITPNDFTNPVIYKVTAADGSTTNYTVSVTVASVSAKEITTYSLNGIAGVITDHNIKVTMPSDTESLTALIATFTTTGTSITVNNMPQVSEITPNDFTNPVIYTVTAADGSTTTYTVTVTIAVTYSSAKEITAYSLGGIAGAITDHNINITMPYNTNTESLIATFTTTGVSITVNNLPQVSESTPNDFTRPVIYTVTAADGSTANYTITVTVDAHIAYVANLGDDTIKQCSIHSTTGALYNCTTTASDIQFNDPTSITLNNDFAYIVNHESSNIIKCAVNPITKELSNCAVNASDLRYPTTMAINNGIAYIVGQNSQTVYKCTIDSATGDLSNCTSTGSGFTYPVAILFNNGFAYITNTETDNSTVSQCTVDQITGELNNCTAAGSGFNYASGIMMNNGWAYVSNRKSNSVNQCTVDTLGKLTNCITTGSNFTYPYGIVSNNGFVYVANRISGTQSGITTCTTDSLSGEFKNCTVDSQFSSPEGITIN